MRRRVLLFVEPFLYVSLVAAGSVASAIDRPKPPSVARIDQSSPLPSAPETNDRLSLSRMEALVATAMKPVRAGKLRTGQKIFDNLLAHAGPDAVLDQADLLESFGALIVGEGLEHANPTVIAAGIPYLERATPLYVQVFGENHPETAVALQTVADAQLAANPNDSNAVLDTMRRVYRIRLATQGADNVETLAARMHVRALEGAPDITGGDRARMEAAIDDLQEIAITTGDTLVRQRVEIKITASFDIAAIYLNHGDVRRAMIAAQRAWETLARQSFRTCVEMQYVHIRWDQAVTARPDLQAAAGNVRQPCRI